MQTRLLRSQSFFIRVFGIMASFFASSFAVANDGLASHCGERESTFFNARMYRVGTNNAKKILSLCANRDNEPLERIVYRFGTIGKVDMELVATPERKAGIFAQSDPGAHTGLISIVFFNGPYAYEVSEGMGMTTGVRLNVYRNKEKVAAYESYEYESTLEKLKFDRVASPILKRMRPIHPW